MGPMGIEIKVGELPYLKFDGTDMGSPSVGNEVFVNKDGSVRIKSDKAGKFWRNDKGWISVDADDASSKGNKKTWFTPVKVSDEVVALRNVGNNLFCKRLTLDGRTDTLNAYVASISKEARLEVSELAFAREIYNVRFRFSDARVYNRKPVKMAAASAENRSTQINEIEVKVPMKDTVTRSWLSAYSLKVGVKTNIQTGVPHIVDGKIELSAETTWTHDWGKVETEEKVLEATYKVVVPPMTKTVVNVIATKGTCDVPFSYALRETLTDGTTLRYTREDGIYTGVNSFNFDYETVESKL